MSKLPQGFCFPADLKEKLQDPELALEVSVAATLKRIKERIYIT